MEGKERTREELLAQIGELEDTIEVLKGSIIKQNKENLQLQDTVKKLTDRVRKQKNLFDKMTELYVDASWRLKQYEAMEKVRRFTPFEGEKK